MCRQFVTLFVFLRYGLVAQWPGSHHEFFMDMSDLHDRFENGEFGETWMLGSSGNGLKRWLNDDLRQPTNSTRKQINVLHCKTRCVV